MNLSLRQILEATSGKLMTMNDLPNFTSISTDTRTIKRGALFVPISGANYDGHNYITRASQKGALCTLSEKTPVYTDLPVIYVKSTREALLDLAAYYRRLHKVRVVGITGSAGKTTTKEMIAAVLSSKFRVKKTQGNFNNEIGLPLTVFDLEQEDEILVLEMGMNHAGEIRKLSKAGKPDVAVITNIGDAHIENFKNREGILNAKLEILEGLGKDGVAVINGDDSLLTGKIAAKKLLGINVYKPGMSNSVSIIKESINGTECKIRAGKEIELTIPVPGRHMIENAMLAVQVGIHFGLSVKEITAGFASFEPPLNRLTRHFANGLSIFSDTYNASPQSMFAALQVFDLDENSKRKVAVLGDMAELGAFSDKNHTEVGEAAAGAGIDLLIAIGNNSKIYADVFKEKNKECYHFDSIEDFTTDWKKYLKPGDCVLVKAARMMTFEKIVESLLVE